MGRPGTCLHIGYAWDAPALCHNPLYFEDVNLERYGYSLRYARVFQPVVSGAEFFVTGAGDALPTDRDAALGMRIHSRLLSARRLRALSMELSAVFGERRPGRGVDRCRVGFHYPVGNSC